MVVCREDGTVEVHGRDCKEVGWDGYYSDGLVDAANPFGAAIKTVKGNEQEALRDVLYFPCLAPDYEPPEGRPRRQRRPTRRAVPFDPDDDADAAIIEACLGRRVTWRSDITDKEEYGVLYPEGPHIKVIQGREITSYPHNYTTIGISSTGRRILNFLHRGDRSVGACFRSVALDTIVSVK